MMETTLSVSGKTVFAEATVAADGSLHFQNPIPALKPGEKVLLIISPKSEMIAENSKPLLGTVTRYDDPFGSAAPLEEWEALRGC